MNNVEAGLSPPLFDIPTQPRWGAITIVKPVTQGSRAARQPRAKLYNRFAVQITFRLNQSFLQFVAPDPMSGRLFGLSPLVNFG
jgi:hypothetical protein